MSVPNQKDHGHQYKFIGVTRQLGGEFKAADDHGQRGSRNVLRLSADTQSRTRWDDDRMRHAAVPCRRDGGSYHPVKQGHLVTLNA
jgi:hypothetical protein